MHFKDRTEAGKKLAQTLKKKYAKRAGVVYALPRGGVPLGVEIALALDMPLDLAIPRKIGHPLNPEYAICAVTENGETVCNQQELARVSPGWFEQRVAEERQEAARRRQLYLGDRKPAVVQGKTAIIVDDGIATGLTMRAAIRDIGHRQPAHVVVAIPVSPKDTAEVLSAEVDEVVALDVPEFYLGAVGAYYDYFPQLSDDEVISLLQTIEPQEEIN